MRGFPDRTASMRSPCDTCAFRDGCVTQDEPQNVLRAEVAVAVPLPFYCHHVGDDDYSNLKTSRLSAAEAVALRRIMPICEGWRRRVAAENAAGRYPRNPETRRFRRWVGTHALVLIRDFIDAADDAKDEIATKLQNALMLLR